MPEAGRFVHKPFGVVLVENFQVLVAHLGHHVIRAFAGGQGHGSVGVAKLRRTTATDTCAPAANIHGAPHIVLQMPGFTIVWFGENIAVAHFARYRFLGDKRLHANGTEVYNSVYISFGCFQLFENKGALHMHFLSLEIYIGPSKSPNFGQSQAG